MILSSNRIVSTHFCLAFFFHPTHNITLTKKTLTKKNHLQNHEEHNHKVVSSQLFFTHNNNTIGFYFGYKHFSSHFHT